MKKNIIITVLALILSAGFIAGGITALMTRNNKVQQNDTTLAQLYEEKTKYSVQELEKEENDLTQSNQTLQSEVQELEKACTELDGQTAQLQQQYDELSQNEQNVYYMTILEALTEGMKKVEAYINDPQ